jgi:hypothetical protein
MKIVKLEGLPEYLGFGVDEQGSISFKSGNVSWVPLRTLWFLAEYVEFVSEGTRSLLMLKGPTIVCNPQSIPSLLSDNHCSIMVLGIALKTAMEQENANFQMDLKIWDNLDSSLTLSDPSNVLFPRVEPLRAPLTLLERDQLFFDDLARFRVNGAPIFLELIQF